MLEKDVEKYLHERVVELGGFTRKWVSPQHNNVEDRICFFPAGELWFIEMKKPGEKPTDKQWREIFRQRKLGHNAGYLSSFEEVDAFLITKYRVKWMMDHINANYKEL